VRQDEHNVAGGVQSTKAGRKKVVGTGKKNRATRVAGLGGMGQNIRMTWLQERLGKLGSEGLVFRYRRL
jgi:hypothetical protein